MAKGGDVADRDCRFAERRLGESDAPSGNPRRGRYLVLASPAGSRPHASTGRHQFEVGGVVDGSGAPVTTMPWRDPPPPPPLPREGVGCCAGGGMASGGGNTEAGRNSANVGSSTSRAGRKLPFAKSIWSVALPSLSVTTCHDGEASARRSTEKSKSPLDGERRARVTGVLKFRVTSAFSLFRRTTWAPLRT